MATIRHHAEVALAHPERTTTRDLAEAVLAVPGVAGMTWMPDRKFLLWNVLGAIMWAPAMVIGAYLAGNSFRAVEHWLGRASLVTAAAATMVVVAWAGSRRLRSRRAHALQAVT